MIIWLSLIIPILFCIGIYIFLRKYAAWWEYLILITSSIIFILISKFAIETSITSDTEYWGSYVVKVFYEEPWDEYIHQTCTRTVGSGKNAHTETYDCSYVRNHSAQYYLKTNIGETIDITPDKYFWYVKRFNNQHFQDMYRNYHSYDGDMYYTNHDGMFETIDPITTIHTYENRVAVSNSIFNFETVDTSIIKDLFEYPEVIDYKVPSILTKKNNIKGLKDAIYTLNKHNALLGATKQCRIWILIFDNKPESYGIEQENYWKGGNKNEFIIALSLNNDVMQWAKIISWTESDELKILIRNYLYENANKFDLYNIVQYTTDQIKLKFKRKSFKDFSYLSVEPSSNAILIVFILNILLSIGIAIFIVKNDINKNDYEGTSIKDYFRRNNKYYRN